MFLCRLVCLFFICICFLHWSKPFYITLYYMVFIKVKKVAKFFKCQHLYVWTSWGHLNLFFYNTTSASTIVFKGNGSGCEPWLGLPIGAHFGDDTSPSHCWLIARWKSGANQWTLPTLGLTWFCCRCEVEKLMLVSKKVFKNLQLTIKKHRLEYTLVENPRILTKSL